MTIYAREFEIKQRAIKLQKLICNKRQSIGCRIEVLYLDRVLSNDLASNEVSRSVDTWPELQEPFLLNILCNIVKTRADTKGKALRRKLKCRKIDIAISQKTVSTSQPDQ